MKTVISKVWRQFGLIRKVGLRQYTRYHLSKKGSLVEIKIYGHQIAIRKGTPDLKVALSCLGGEFKILKYLFPNNFDGIIIDAGGYIGASTLALKQMFPKSKIIIVEPSEENMSVLKKNLEGMANVHIIHGALIGSYQKRIELYNRGTGEWGFTVVTNPEDNPSAQFLRSTPAYRLDDLVSEDEQIGLLKLDIEGGELDLFENDVVNMKKIDVVLAELHNRIVSGCEEKFFEFSSDRIVIKARGEKFLSIKR